mmetsp:Transcript_73706/g.240069  ORF Transcript_73706/g.240069 Transcript_73706/m.240069 type:complete len:252 (-) Transcript_73706:196-951(-)
MWPAKHRKPKTRWLLGCWQVARARPARSRRPMPRGVIGSREASLGKLPAVPSAAPLRRGAGDDEDREHGPANEHEYFTAWSSSQADSHCEPHFTALFLQHLPVTYSREVLLQTLNAEGFACAFDFVYVPVDLITMSCSGTAFINFRTHDDAVRAVQHFSGFTRWLHSESTEICRASWSNFCQGLKAHIERYRNSPVMHEKVANICKPMIFNLGVPVPFPAPTKRLRVPRQRGKTSQRGRGGKAEEVGEEEC